jgi:hypothetical protein
MSEVFNVGDPDASVTYPITDSTGGNVDWPDPQVLAGEVTLSATWEGAPAPTRDITVPLDALPVGSYYLWLVVPGADDILLGEVSIINPLSGPVSQPTECLWPVDPACLTDAWDGYSESVRLRARRLASNTLRMLTAARVGVCPITVRPVPARGQCLIPRDSYYWSGQPFVPGINVAGQWVNTTGGSALAQVNCEIELPAPVTRLDEIKVDGVALSLADFRVDNQRYLVWQGVGECPIPVTQNFNLPDTEVGTFSVTYLNAYEPGASGAHAAGILAAEFAKACVGGKCRLPNGVTSIVRQGIAMEVQAGNFPGGFTGIKEVDAYIASWNPNALKMAPQVFSPDRPTTRITTLGG